MLKRPVKANGKPFAWGWKTTPDPKTLRFINGATSLYRDIRLPNAVQSK